LAGALAIGACNSSISELEQSEGAARAEVEFNENYLVVYQRVRKIALQCRDGNVGATASLEIDNELYDELGCGEVTSRLNSIGLNSYNYQIRIERTGPSRSILRVVSGGTVNNQIAIDIVTGWAQGSLRCDGL